MPESKKTRSLTITDLSQIEISVDVMAKLTGRSTRWIQVRASEGDIPRIDRGRYPLVEAVQGYIRYQNRLIEGRGDDTVIQEKTLLIKARREKLERENDIASRELLHRPAVVAAMSALVANSRARLLAIPSRLAPQLVSIDNAAEIHSLVTEAIHEALYELSETRAVAVSTNPNGDSP